MSKQTPQPLEGADVHPGADPAGLTFEQAAQELDQIIEKIDSGEIGLEQSIAAYERGVALVNRCRAILDRAEQRVAELTPPPGDGGGKARP